MKEIEGFVLNGGMSSRMGTAKGSLRIGQLTFAQHAANALRAVCDRVYAVGGELSVEGVEALADVNWNGKNERASIFGLRSALLALFDKICRRSRVRHAVRDRRSHFAIGR
jgi:molybdopterin-guanine dinucleotide biosynthesis protein A